MVLSEKAPPAQKRVAPSQSASFPSSVSTSSEATPARIEWADSLVYQYSNIDTSLSLNQTQGTSAKSFQCCERAKGSGGQDRVSLLVQSVNCATRFKTKHRVTRLKERAPSPSAAKEPKEVAKAALPCPVVVQQEDASKGKPWWVRQEVVLRWSVEERWFSKGPVRWWWTCRRRRSWSSATAVRRASATAVGGCGAPSAASTPHPAPVPFRAPFSGPVPVAFADSTVPRPAPFAARRLRPWVTRFWLLGNNSTLIIHFQDSFLRPRQ